MVHEKTWRSKVASRSLSVTVFSEIDVGITDASRNGGLYAAGSILALLPT